MKKEANKQGKKAKAAIDWRKRLQRQVNDIFASDDELSVKMKKLAKVKAEMEKWLKDIVG